MAVPMQAIANLPGPVKGGIVLVGGGGLLAAAWAAGVSPGFLIFLAAGAAVVVLLLLCYKRIAAMAQRGKGGALLKGLLSGGSAATSAELKAQLDDLRKKFEAGMEVFKTHGKTPLDVPWYLLVGEPGSGKSYLIRKVGRSGQWFPSGLQDELQGLGGTINMHWWFMKPAVVIDTAGKMLMKEVKTGESSEWKEFLKLLRNARPTCPINGMLLVIPADSLIRDRTEDIERKAGHIARQLELIQRTLDVRFPVFVVVTKCDLITGFRDFFSNVDDPQLQHQMLGWSNPATIAELDKPFSPSDVDEHLEQVCQRLARRRLTLLLDPVSAKDPRARRTDEVDSMYALPESLAKIGPRLRRYLEIIFVAGEWSPKPLFLRGIYFTSSVQEGSELDQALAEALGVSVDTLLGGQMEDRERALFLLDLFRDKIFREKGLVTRASNVKKQQQRRRTVMMSAGIGVTLLLIGLTVISGAKLTREIEQPRQFWQDMAEQQAAPGASGLAILERKGPGRYVYLGGEERRFGHTGKTLRLAQIPTETVRQADASITVPAVFRLLTGLSGDLKRSDRISAHAGMLAENLIGPAVEAARQKMRDPDLVWDEHATAALAELLRLERDAYTAGSSVAGLSALPSPINLDRLYRFVLDDEEYAKFKTDARDLQAAVNWTFFDAKGLAAAWPAPGLNAGSAEAAQTIARGLERFLASPDGRGAGGAAWTQLEQLRAAIGSFREAEDRLLTIDDAYAGGPEAEPRTMPLYSAVRDQWAAEYGALKGLLPALQSVVEALGGGSLPPVATLVERASTETVARAQQAYDTLLEPLKEADAALRGAAAPGEQPAAGATAPIVAAYAALRERRDSLGAAVQTQIADLRSALTSLDKDFLSRSRDGEPLAFQVRASMYRLADAELSPESAPPPMASVAEILGALDRSVNSATASIELGAGTAESRNGQAAAVSKFILRLARRERAYRALDAGIKVLPSTIDEMGRAISSRAGGDLSVWERPKFAMSDAADQFDARYHPDAAAAVLRDVAAVQKNLAGAGGTNGSGAPVLEADELRAAARALQEVYDQYLRDYLRYWSVTVFDEAKPAPFASWEAFQEAMRNAHVTSINGRLRDLGEQAAKALEIPDVVGARDDGRAAAAEIRRAMGDLSREFGDEIDELVFNWGRLPKDVPGARDAILGMDAQLEFAKRYLVAADIERPGFPRRYWSAVFVRGLTILAQTSQGQAGEALGRLKTVHRKFPFCKDPASKQAMSPAEVAAAIRDIGLVSAGSAASARTNPGGPTGDLVRDGGHTRIREVDDQLDALTGVRLLSSDQESWLRRVAAVAAALGGEKSLSSVEVLRAEYEAQQELPAVPGAEALKDAANRFGYLEVRTADGDAGGLRRATRGDSEPLQSAPVAVPGKRLQVSFYIGEFDEAAAVGPVELGESWTGEWSSLGALLATPGAKAGPDGTTWYVPLVFRDASGQGYYYWLKLKFNRPLPGLDAWPSDAEWPK